MLELIIIVIGLGIGLVAITAQKRRSNLLPDVTDEVFIQKFNAEFPGLAQEAVLKNRNYLARELDLPYHKLDPSCTFEELLSRMNVLGSYDLVIGDLESTLSELLEKTQVKKPYKTPSTIGELVFLLVKANTVDDTPKDDVTSENPDE